MMTINIGRSIVLTLLLLGWNIAYGSDCSENKVLQADLIDRIGEIERKTILENADVRYLIRPLIDGFNIDWGSCTGFTDSVRDAAVNALENRQDEVIDELIRLSNQVIPVTPDLEKVAAIKEEKQAAKSALQKLGVDHFSPSNKTVMEIFSTQGITPRWEIVNKSKNSAKNQMLSDGTAQLPFYQPRSEGYVMRPVIENSQDVLALVNSEFGKPILGLKPATFLQTVPGVPNDPRFEDPKFDPIKNAFTQGCIKSAEQYSTSTRNLVNVDEAKFGTELNTSRLKSDSYEKNCLISLQAVPKGIRRVIGVLTYDNTTFCSATIIGDDQILTSRHCFFNADSGKARNFWDALNKKVIGFSTALKHSNRNNFPVRAIDPRNEIEVSFKPFQDHIILKISGVKFGYKAAVADALLKNETPVMVWVIGSNALIGDVRNLKKPLEFVRGSLPKSCAVMDVTENGCIYHTCQTGATTSGAGVLQLADDGLSVTLLGVHKGPVSRAVGCELNPPTSLSINLAALYTNN